MLNPYDWDAFYGDSDFDIRHNLNANVLFDLPFGHNKPFLSSAGNVMNAIVGDWQVSGIFRYSSGLPTSVHTAASGRRTTRSPPSPIRSVPTRIT
jgi:hypothetical protein